MQGDELDQFIADILTAKQLSGVTDEVRVQLTADLKERLLDQINRALINALDDEQIAQFNALLDDSSTDDQAAQQFIVNSGVDVRQVTAKTMLRFRDLYLNPNAEEAK